MEIVKEYIVMNASGKTIRVVLTDTGHYFEVNGSQVINISKAKFEEMQVDILVISDLNEQA